METNPSDQSPYQKQNFVEDGQKQVSQFSSAVKLRLVFLLHSNYFV